MVQAVAVGFFSSLQYTSMKTLAYADVTEREEAFAAVAESERRQRLLIDELNHRVKNTLAAVQSISRQSAKRAGSLEDFRNLFESRLVALNQLLEVNCALLIDRLAGLRNTEAFVSSNDAPEGAPDYFGSGYTDASGAYWQEINLQALSQQPQFLSISA